MKKKEIAALGILLLLAAIPRLHSLDAFTSPDEAQWERNTQNFVKALKIWDTKNFYQQPHPGITTQWLSAATINASTWGIKRLPLAAFLSVAVVYLAWLTYRLWGPSAATWAGILLALNPQLIAHSRILSMDALLAVFLMAAVLHHLHWLRTYKKIDAAAVGIFISLAFLSKMSAFGIVPYLILATAIGLRSNPQKPNKPWQHLGLVVGTGLITLIILLPTIITHPDIVIAGTKTFFTTEHFQQAVHALGPYWYPQALAIWVTPLQITGLALALPWLLKKSSYRLPLALLVCWCLIFFLEVQYSIKKGDRYILPVFVAFDIVAAIGIVKSRDFIFSRKINIRVMAYILIGVFLGLQIFDTIRLHPYLLAYRNPFFKQIAHGRTMGWGEGLDLASQYLNTKDNASNLLVAAYYEGSFAYHFKGKFTSAERLAHTSAEEIGADYVVLYRTMEGRAPERWETKVLQEYRSHKPEKTITLNGEEYVWIYSTKK